ncbi:MAG: symmetrical bis(5'-nucleosyl)-tetraphosphatase [Acidiferrobacterales bacterium]
MGVYAIGDVQGCADALYALLDQIGFEARSDELWFTGDLVNRGPASAEVLRFVMSLRDRAHVVLGNHDLHLLALAAGKGKSHPQDTLEDVLGAPDRAQLLGWLRTRPLLHHDAHLGFTLVHAGLLPSWDLAQAQELAREAEKAIRQSEESGFFDHMYGNQPDQWEESLRGWERLRVVINALTRLRYCDGAGKMDLRHKGTPGTQPAGFVPWFEAADRANRDLRIIFGHWSTLGLWQGQGVIGLDSGCLWGGKLTALRLDGETAFYSVPCRSYRPVTSGSR